MTILEAIFVVTVLSGHILSEPAYLSAKDADDLIYELDESNDQIEKLVKERDKLIAEHKKNYTQTAKENGRIMSELPDLSPHDFQTVLKYYRNQIEELKDSNTELVKERDKLITEHKKNHSLTAKEKGHVTPGLTYITDADIVRMVDEHEEVEDLNNKIGKVVKERDKLINENSDLKRNVTELAFYKTVFEYKKSALFIEDCMAYGETMVKTYDEAYNKMGQVYQYIKSCKKEELSNVWWIFFAVIEEIIKAHEGIDVDIVSERMANATMTDDKNAFCGQELRDYREKLHPNLKCSLRKEVGQIYVYPFLKEIYLRSINYPGGQQNFAEEIVLLHDELEKVIEKHVRLGPHLDDLPLPPRAHRAFEILRQVEPKFIKKKFKPEKK